jgi:hypothetical protein
MAPISTIPNHLSITSCAADGCPLGSGWHQTWRSFTLDRVSTSEWFRRFDVLQRRLAGTPTLTWSIGPGDASCFPNRHTPPLRTAMHRHAAFEVVGHNVHIDLIGGTGGSPGFSLRALLVYVDGEFRGSAWIYGCLGGNGYSFPCVTRINDSLAVYGNYLAGRCDGMPYVHVRRASPPRVVQESETGAEPESLTVRMGTLTQLEFDALRTKHQQFMEEATRELLDRFGEGFFGRNNDHLRNEFEIARLGLRIEQEDRYPQTWRKSRRRV